MEERKKSGKELELDSLILEYKNSFERSNKLDNKVYITITFCGFLFVFITNLFSGITKLTLPESSLQWFLAIVYVLLWLGTCATYIYSLIYFMRLLYPEGLERIDPDKISSLHMERMSSDEALDALIRLYRETINGNLIKLKNRCDHLTQGLHIVIYQVILAFVTYAVQKLAV